MREVIFNLQLQNYKTDFASDKSLKVMSKTSFCIRSTQCILYWSRLNTSNRWNSRFIYLCHATKLPQRLSAISITVQENKVCEKVSLFCNVFTLCCVTAWAQRRQNKDWHTVKSAYKEPDNKELPVIRNYFSFPNLQQGTSLLYVYKEHIAMVSMSSL